MPISPTAFFKQIPWVKKLLQKDEYLNFRHKITLRIDKRTNDTFTGFLRLPTQFEALTERCIKYVAEKKDMRKLKICVAGCSNGAEAYTISSVLQNKYPNLDFEITAFDIDAEIIKKARTASYQEEEILNNKIITDDFLQFTFDIADKIYKVKKKISERVFFIEGNILDSDFINAKSGFDIVFAQNFLLHLKRKDIIKAIQNVTFLLKDKGILFMDGVDIDIRMKRLNKNGFSPLNYKIEKIHNEARRARGVGWPYRYWGLEPFSQYRRNWQTRYATIFFKQRNNFI